MDLVQQMHLVALEVLKNMEQEIILEHTQMVIGRVMEVVGGMDMLEQILL
mgnify:CR=1 FL=1